MGRYYLIDGLAWCAILCWLGFSILCAANGNAEMFQRLGALGIVFGVIYYAVLPPPVVHPAGLIESLSWRDKTTIVMANGVTAANANVSLLAALLKKVLEDEGKVAPESILALAKPTMDRVAQGQPYPPELNRDLEIENNAADSTAADHEASRRERIRFITQATLVVVGTLQNGFGSLMVPAG